MIAINLLGAILLVLCIIAIICCLTRGNLTIRNPHGHNWSLFTWLCAVFTGSEGVSLILGTLNDINSFQALGYSTNEAVLMDILYNVAPWSMFALVGYWYCFHFNSKFGKVMAMLSTIFGISISLWTGVSSIIRFLGFNFIGLNSLVMGVIVILAVMSAKFDWLKKISVFGCLSIAVTVFILLAIPNNMYEVSKLTGEIRPNVLFKEIFTGKLSSSWWWWWVSWAPTVGRWLAYISNGRSKRTYFLGTLLIPSIVSLIYVLTVYRYSNVIGTASIVRNSNTVICITLIITAILMMVGTIDSDCKVFVEDFDYLVNKTRKNPSAYIPLYVSMVAIEFIILSGFAKDPWTFNNIVSVVFTPLIIASVLFVFTKKRGIKK